MILYLKKIVILFNHDVLPPNNLRFFYTVKHFIVKLRSFLYQSELSCVTMGHFFIQFPMKKESYQKPVNPYKPISFAFKKKHNDGDNDRERSLKYEVHIAKHGEDQL